MKSSRGLPNEVGIRAPARAESPEAIEPMPFQSAPQSQIFMGGSNEAEVLRGHSEMDKTQFLP